MGRARPLVIAIACGCTTAPPEAGIVPDADTGTPTSSTSGAIATTTTIADDGGSAVGPDTAMPEGTSASPQSTGVVDTCGDGHLDAGEFCPGAASSYPAAMRPRALAIGDFDGDADRDLAVGAEMTGDVLVLANLGDGTFATAVPQVTYLDATLVLSAADLRADDRQDLVVGNRATTINVFASNGSGFELAASLGTPGAYPAFAIADFDGEPGDDLAVGRPDGTIDFHHGDDNGYLSWRTYMVGWPNPSAIVAGELDADVGAELVAAADDGHLTVLRGFDNNTAIATTVIADAGLVAMALGDFDGDAALDLAGLGIDQGSVTIWRNTGDDDVFAELTELAVTPGLFELEVGDLDHDGTTDLVVLAKDVAAILVLRGHGDGSFAPAQQLAVSEGPIDVALGDLDGDGALDLAVACAAGTVDVLLSTP